MAECGNNQHAKQSLNSDGEALKLPDLLDRGWKIFEEVDSTNEPLGSNSIQVAVKRGMSMLEEASRMVAQLDLFSRNEELEEVATADLKYLLLPALLGALTMKQTNRDKRLDFLQAARAYFMDFLRRCKDYNISQFELPKTTNDSSRDEGSANGDATAKCAPCSADLVSLAAQRQAKIERYRQRKDLEARLSEARRAMDSGQADDEARRDFYLLHVRRWVTLCLEEMESIEQEVEILKKMDGLKQGAAKQPSAPVRPPMKPFILTKDAVQAQVFGAGYPSLPTMTVNDWYEEHRKHGTLPHQEGRKVVVEEDTDAKEREEEEKEKKAENDDEESLMKARNWDDWKETHPRGYGNRHNMG